MGTENMAWTEYQMVAQKMTYAGRIAGSPIRALVCQ